MPDLTVQLKFTFLTSVISELYCILNELVEQIWRYIEWRAIYFLHIIIVTVFITTGVTKRREVLEIEPRMRQKSERLCHK